MKSIITLSSSVRSMSSDKVAFYECQYLDETVAIEATRLLVPDPCEGCDFITEEADINCAYCPADFDVKNPNCPKSYIYTNFKRYLIEVDLMLRNTLGDIWRDEYSA